MTKERAFGKSRMAHVDVFRMVKRRCRVAGIGSAANCHTFRATGITAYLLNGGPIEGAQAIAAHEGVTTPNVKNSTLRLGGPIY